MGGKCRARDVNVGGGTWIEHAQQDFARGSAGQNEKYSMGSVGGIGSTGM